jgi:hypothetical protein
MMKEPLDMAQLLADSGWSFWGTKRPWLPWIKDPNFHWWKTSIGWFKKEK